MSDTNCPNCGAPIDLEFDKCPYCGTTWLNLANIDIENRRPMYFKLRYKDIVFIAKSYCTSCEIEQRPEIIYVPSELDGVYPLSVVARNKMTVNLSFEGV